MAFDGIITNAVVTEINKIKQKDSIARVEKITMPTKNEVIFALHSVLGKQKLLFSIDASLARFHFTTHLKENPMKAPQFCMVLRKYLQGAKLLSVKQYGLDRVVCFLFENLNELGDLVSYSLYVELMGKYSNLILVNSNNKIIDSARHVDASMSSVREVLPAREYILPSTLEKNEFLQMGYDNFVANLQLASMDPFFSLDTMTKIIANQFVGFSKTFIEQLFKDCHLVLPFTKQNTQDLFQTIQQVLFHVANHQAKLVKFEKDYHIAFNEFGPLETPTAVSDFLDAYYNEKEAMQSFRTYQLNLQREVNSFKSKYEKNQKRVQEILDEAQNMEKYKLYGELISANIYQMKNGMKEITVPNYYDNNQLLTIPLQENLSPARNAQNYFKKYTKQKNAILHATSQMEEYKKNIDYLEDVLYLIDEASTLSELYSLKEELAQAGYLKIASGKKKHYDELPLEPYRYTYDGVSILVGRNNLQNDLLTFKIAKKNDTWLHVKDIHGSHVIIQSETITDALLYHAATLAILHSQAKNTSKIAVDYALVKYVHKPSGAKPGKVVYTNYKTIIV